MTELRFDGKVAIVTGAGRGIGRGYAKLLAARGAAVVVNDLGGSIDGSGSDQRPAERVVEEIIAAGGRATADANDISTTEGAEALISRATTDFGRIDILVNNAGIVDYAGLPHVDADNLRRHLDVHLFGSFNTTRAAWPHFIEQSYGRVVLTTSSGVFGMDANLSYAAAKAGTIGLARSAKIAGEPHNIKVNLVAPAAQTRMAGGDIADDEASYDNSIMPPSAVAPIVAVLAHEQCPVSGEIYTAGAGRFARLFIASTAGQHFTGGTTPEDVLAQWGQINDETGYYIPTDVMDWSGKFLSHLFPQGAGAAS
ncbi:MAG: SDR family NAD(P)-dependent oxidoreductase [Gordonia sp. (in: high G+C Gram-positive bacteria)]